MNKPHCNVLLHFPFLDKNRQQG